MPPREKFKLREKAALAAAVSAALPGAALAEGTAGRVNFAIGDVTRAGASGGAQRLKRGSLVYSGDTIRTTRGRVQIRFNDGGFMSLKPNTEFQIEEYKFEKATESEGRSIFRLLRGGLRTITGLIGKRTRNAYQLKTRVATIGIRGTGYGADDDGELVALSVLDGLVEMCNDAGCVLGQPGAVMQFVSSSQVGSVVSDADNSNNVTDSEAENRPDTRKRIPIGEETDGEGNAIFEAESGPQLESGPGYALAIAHGSGDVIEGGFSFPLADSESVNATFVGSGSALVSYDGSGNVGSGTIGAGTVVTEFGNNGVIGWGRWTGGITSGSGPHPLDLSQGIRSMHYVVGKPTAVMPSTGIVNYKLLGSTTPTTASGRGNLASNTLNSASMTVNFGLSSAFLNLNVTADVNGALRQYDVTNMNLSVSGPTFSGSSGSVTEQRVGECSGACLARATGFFSGENAAFAGFNYSIETTRSSGIGPDEIVIGVATLEADPASSGGL